MKHIAQITNNSLTPMEEFGVSAYLDDFAVSDDSHSPITAGLFRLEKGKELTYTYTYHEMKIVLEGESATAVVNGSDGAAPTLNNILSKRL